MKKYKILGGGEIAASSSLSLLTQMMEQSRTPSESLGDFMHQMAQRCQIQKGASVRTDSVDNCVEDLKSAGFVEELN